jgi:hypothetical protein
VRGPQPCLRHARPRNVRPAQPPEGQGRCSKQRGGAPRSLHKTGTARWPVNTKAHLTATASSGACPGAPTRRGAARLRLDGQHTGKIRVPAARFDVAGPALEGIQEGREEVKMDTTALTSGRRCRRGRLGEGCHVGGVDVHGGGFIPAPVRSQSASRPSGVAWRRRPSSSPLPALTQSKRNRKPQWGWWLGQLGFRPPPSLLKYGGVRGDAKALTYPRVDPPPPPEWARWHPPPPRRPSLRGARRRGKWVKARLGRPVRARVPVARLVGRPGGEAVPSRVHGAERRGAALRWGKK